MPTKWDRWKDTLQRGWNDMEFPTATFYKFDETYDDNTGDISVNRTKIGSTPMEITPPSINTQKDELGTEMEIDAEGRIPDTETTILNDIETYGEASQKASEVEVDGNRYIIEGRRPEVNSGFVKLRLSEKK